MQMRHLLLPAWILCFFSVTPAAAGDGPPNVLMIAIDDLNDWIGCLQGHPQTLTPNIDRLAARGVLFSNAHCASPACNPSRAALFTGQMPWRTGVWSNDSQRLFQQHPDARVLPRAFQEAGYRTWGTGKMMHSQAAANKLMFEESFNPEQRWSPFTRKQTDYTPEELPSKGSARPRHVIAADGLPRTILPLNGLPSDRNPQEPAAESFDWGPLDVPDSTMGDTQITDWAIRRLQQPHNKPFFLGVGYYRPHIPLWAPAAYFQRFGNQQIQLPPHLDADLQDLSDTGRRWAIEAITAGLHQTVVDSGQWADAVKAYLACVTYVDAQIGRLLDALDQSAAAADTIVVLWSDHGWHLGEKQHWGKWTGWERSTRVPMIIVPKAAGISASAGQICHAPVSLLDIYPTLAELCNVSPPAAADGLSLLPQLRNPQLESDRVVTTSFDQGNFSLRNQRWRYLRYADGTEEIYDLQEDPNEWTNLLNSPTAETALRKLRSHADAVSAQATAP